MNCELRRSVGDEDDFNEPWGQLVFRYLFLRQFPPDLEISHFS